jgi:ABC-type amino acid transport substrate-binding protein
VWEAQLYPEDTAAWAAMVTPGSAVVKSLIVLDADRMTQTGRVDVLVAVDTLAAWVAARQLRVLAPIADDPMTSSPAPMLDKQWVKEGVRAALGESAVGSGSRSPWPPSCGTGCRTP